MKNILLAACLFVLPVGGNAADVTQGDITVENPIARATTPTAMTSAGYFTVVNNGDEADTLLEVSADFPRVMMHDTTMQDGIATMFHLENGVIVPAGESVTFAPGGKHVMFMGLKGDPLEIGEEIPATLTFENAGMVEIVFVVSEIGVITKD